MKKLKILSIDWDYFIDATAYQRLSLFPDGGNENLPKYVKDIAWSGHYINNELSKIGIKKDDLNKTIDIINKNNFKDIMIANSHKEIYNFIENNLYDESKIDVINIDFHHDLYKNGEDVDCGNWMSKLFENYNCDYTWVLQNDSDRLENNEHTIKESNLNDIDMNDYDLLYIAKSDMWSPPHLDEEFKKAFYFLMEQKTMMVTYQLNIFDNRYENIKELVDKQRSIMNWHNDNEER